MVRNVHCVVLPTGRSISVDGDLLRPADVQQKLADVLGVPLEAVELLEERSDEKAGLARARCGAALVEPVLALVRCRAGGKGGFRKQLEKKGREFARAKLKEKRVSKSETQSAKAAETPAKQLPKETKARSTPGVDVDQTRSIAKQGVALAVARATQVRQPQ